MPRYFRWEGIDENGRGDFCTGVIEAPGNWAPLSAPVSEAEVSCLQNRLKARGVALVWWTCIGPDEYVSKARMQARAQSPKSMSAAIRFASGAIGLAGCSAAAILLPMPVAIWAASAFAALVAAAAVPP